MQIQLEWWHLVTGFLLAITPYLIQVYNRWKESKDKEPEHKIEERKQALTESERLFQEWENIAEGYAKQIESLRRLETENAELRPLVLRVALMAQELKQCKEDKEDWKGYSTRLSAQIEGLGHIPLAFRRTPRDGDTQEKMRTISQKMKAVQQEAQHAQQEADAAAIAIADSPTLIVTTKEDVK